MELERILLKFYTDILLFPVLSRFLLHCFFNNNKKRLMLVKIIDFVLLLFWLENGFFQ